MSQDEMNAENPYNPQPLDRDCNDIDIVAERTRKIALAADMIVVPRDLMLFAMMQEHPFIVKELNRLMGTTKSKDYEIGKGTQFYQSLFCKYEAYQKHGTSTEYETERVMEMRSMHDSGNELEKWQKESLEYQKAKKTILDVEMLSVLHEKLLPLSRPNLSDRKRQTMRQKIWTECLLIGADATQPDYTGIGPIHLRTRGLREYLFDKEGEKLLPRLAKFAKITYPEKENSEEDEPELTEAEQAQKEAIVKQYGPTAKENTEEMADRKKTLSIAGMQMNFFQNMMASIPPYFKYTVVLAFGVWMGCEGKKAAINYELMEFQRNIYKELYENELQKQDEDVDPDEEEGETHESDAPAEELYRLTRRNAYILR